MPEVDLLNQVKTVLKADLNALKYSRTIMNVEKIPDAKVLSIRYGFPAIGIIDAGENDDYKASTLFSTEMVVIAVYVDVVGDHEKCMDEVRAVLKKCIARLREKELYRVGGAFAGYSRARCNKLSEIVWLWKDDEKPLIMKLAKIGFTRQEVIN